MKRLIEQESCDHGKFEKHSDPMVNLAGICPGGSSREVTVDLDAVTRIGLDAATEANGLILGEEAIRAVWRAVPAAVDAALAGGG